MNKPDSTVRDRVKALLDAEIQETRYSRSRAARDAVRCFRCDLMYAERQEYGCGESGYGHVYDHVELAEVAQKALDEKVEYVTLSVDDLINALGVEDETDQVA